MATGSPRVKIYQPDIRVTLYKTVKRTTLDGETVTSSRFQGMVGQQIDLVPFLSDQHPVHTLKSISEPAGGFSITLADKPLKQDGAFESLVGLIEPMDMVEIRFRHDPPDLIGNVINGAEQDPTRPPIIMRGFVSEIARTETMSADGRPQRMVVITGQDFGKLWQQMQIVFLPFYVVGEGYLTNFKLFERFGVGFRVSMTSAEFITEMIQKVVNPYVAGLMPSNVPNPPKLDEIKLDVQVAHGTCAVTSLQNQEGTIHGLLKTYLDVGIWNELFIEDREDGVYCVFRPNPSKDINGDPIIPKIHYYPDYQSPVTIDLPDYDVIASRLTRSDASLANFYWVRAPRFEMVDDIYRTLFALQGADKDTVDLQGYQNSLASLYGTRVMYGQTEQGGDDTNSFTSGLPADDQLKRNSDVANWVRSRRQFMVEQNKDNVLLERGTFRIRGNENIRAGMFVRLRRGGFSAEYYVVTVEHEYVPFSGFFSTLTVERGMGFVERAKRGGGADSPYLAEMQETKRG